MGRDAKVLTLMVILLFLGLTVKGARDLTATANSNNNNKNDAAVKDRKTDGDDAGAAVVHPQHFFGGKKGSMPLPCLGGGTGPGTGYGQPGGGAGPGFGYGQPGGGAGPGLGYGQPGGGAGPGQGDGQPGGGIGPGLGPGGVAGPGLEFGQPGGCIGGLGTSTVCTLPGVGRITVQPTLPGGGSGGGLVP